MLCSVPFQAKYFFTNDLFKKEWNLEISTDRFFHQKFDKFIFFTSDKSGELLKVNEKNGEIIWKKRYGREENIWISFFYGIHNNNLIIWRNNNSLISMSVDTGEIIWTINEVPKPKVWEQSNIGFNSFKFSKEESILIGFYKFNLRKVDLEKGIITKPEDYTNVFIEKLITDPAPDYILDGNYIIFSDFFRFF